jgi:hypothetical protein
MYVNAFLYCKSFALKMYKQERKMFLYSMMMMGVDNAITVTYTVFLYMVTYAVAIKKSKDHIYSYFLALFLRILDICASLRHFVCYTAPSNHYILPYYEKQ